MSYERPGTLDDAVRLSGTGEDAAYLAGGHTLIPAMKARLRDPDLLIDLADLDELKGLVTDGERLWIGALTTHAEVSQTAGAIPALQQLASLIGDPQVRVRGTLGGSLANNDPAADYPAAVLALDAVIETDRGSHAADDFFQGMFFTALEEGELIRRVGFRIPKRAAYAKFRHPASRYALAGVFVAEFEDGVRVAVTGAGGDGVFRWTAAEEALAAGTDPASIGAPDVGDMSSDIHAGPEYRAHLCTVMLKQAVGGLS
ncbi:carbon monoxide dehydrogenase [Pacificimonas flava]|uniref:Carbon monoxide dehydrogenase n=2 Tax=Pacificimonas TaxID=1960290 RepID=A0A219B1V6_9SPHN|nr:MULTISPECIES: FAD binding domain-containing protein [Pacificimonas]MBZ6378029.1 FAD binding domain-containing protein [Pacificimonas aurantium]OWV32327.1 carbon monoxide dehydrogenase [Pacificimonas flava]